MNTRSFIRSFYIAYKQLSTIDGGAINLPLPSDIGMSSNVGVGRIGKASDIGYAWLSILGADGLAISFMGPNNVGEVG